MKAAQRKLVGLAPAIVISGFLAQPLSAAEPMTGEAAPAALGDRTHLLGDWGGARPWLEERGTIFDVQATQFYQGVVEGSPDNNWQYGVEGDYFLTVLGEKAGLWKGFILNLHAETRAGDDVNALTGLSPANANMLTPSSADCLTSALMGQTEAFALKFGPSHSEGPVRN